MCALSSSAGRALNRAVEVFNQKWAVPIVQRPDRLLRPSELPLKGEPQKLSGLVHKLWKGNLANSRQRKVPLSRFLSVNNSAPHVVRVLHVIEKLMAQVTGLFYKKSEAHGQSVAKFQILVGEKQRFGSDQKVNELVFGPVTRPTQNRHNFWPKRAGPAAHEIGRSSGAAR
jgi:hypothetical protein